MVRKLKYHEQKLLKKVDFISWKTDDNIREVKILRKYHIQRREDYTKYNKISGIIKSLANKIKDLDTKDPFRVEATDQLLTKLYNMGFITSIKGLAQCEKVNPSAFCRRRLPVVMVRLKMAQAIKDAVKYVEQGHIRVGTEVIMDPAFLVSRNMEDFVTWTDTSKIRKHVMAYNDLRDDFDFS
ncbi:U3 small nucleolar ribonucleoprotein protein IMP3 [Exaiptasia diaphana]|uniref:U3 small nucleolar ribonucleoprotein protein IMP3 n=1 Tax=Exaiptasia diaphana TaxID=2652724 RepID=A0A913YCX4_EXADI|nr:U3 small nucleolar ribonucleoprotein protein IMP3 [Exaiptasia diaphana]